VGVQAGHNCGHICGHKCGHNWPHRWGQLGPQNGHNGMPASLCQLKVGGSGWVESCCRGSVAPSQRVSATGTCNGARPLRAPCPRTQPYKPLLATNGPAQGGNTPAVSAMERLLPWSGAAKASVLWGTLEVGEVWRSWGKQQASAEGSGQWWAGSSSSSSSSSCCCCSMRRSGRRVQI